MKREPPRLAWCFLLPCSLFLCAAAPTTRQAASVEQVARWIAGLMDADPAARDQSFESLLGLRRSDVPVIKQAIKRLGELDDTTMHQMRQVLKHVYLTGEPYRTGEQGFLGIRMPLGDVPQAETKMRIVVQSRLEGFDAFRKLRNGDAIVDIVEKPLAQPADRDEFINTIQKFRPGDEIHLKVLRGGHVITVSLRLAKAASDVIDTPSADAFGRERTVAAEEFIRKEFADVLK